MKKGTSQDVPSSVPFRKSSGLAAVPVPFLGFPKKSENEAKNDEPDEHDGHGERYAPERTCVRPFRVGRGNENDEKQKLKQIGQWCLLSETRTSRLQQSKDK